MIRSHQTEHAGAAAYPPSLRHTRVRSLVLDYALRHTRLRDRRRFR